MKKGDIREIRIDDMSSEGSGIGRADGMVVFVPGTVPGDVVKAELTEVKKRFSKGRISEIVSLSEDRICEYPCPARENGCGGCALADMGYGAQLRLKEKQVKEKLKRLGDIEDPDICSIIGMEEDDNEGLGHLGYRNKAVFHISTGGIVTKKGGIVVPAGDPEIGFFAAGSHDIAEPGEGCLLQSQAASCAAGVLRRFMKEDHITAWDPRWQKGLLRTMTVRTAFATREVMVILGINGKGVPNLEKLAGMLDDALYEAGYSLESIVLKQKDGRTVTAAGRDTIEDMIGDRRFEISAGSFFQVNPAQTVRLYDKVKEYCEGSEVLLDIYCGVGSIGLYCAGSAGYVVGIESVEEAVLAANRNAVINGIVNARYICGKAEEVLPLYAAQDPGENGSGIDSDLAELIRSADTAVLDPPRAGCRPELLEAVAQIGPERIVYVSCDPATLARDVKLLGDMGYGFKEATPVDMFPCTGSIETVCLLIKK